MKSCHILRFIINNYTILGRPYIELQYWSFFQARWVSKKPLAVPEFLARNVFNNIQEDTARKTNYVSDDGDFLIQLVTNFKSSKNLYLNLDYVNSGNTILAQKEF